jgi:hypothetical protein
MEVSSEHHAPATLPPGKYPAVTIGEEAEWDSEAVWTRWKREKSLSLSGIEPCRPARNLVTILTELLLQLY